MGSFRAAAWLGAVLLLAGSACAAAPWRPGDFPDPQKEPERCGRTKAGGICDPDAKLSPSARDRLEGVLLDIAAGTEPYALRDCGGRLEGFQVGVAVLGAGMEVPSGQTPASQAEAFAKELHAAWGVGDAACDNGALLLLAVEDRQVYISTGRGAKAYLSDGQLAAIVAAMRAPLRAGDYDGAVERGVVDIGLGLAGHAPEGGDGGGGGINWLSVLFFSGVVFFIGNSCWSAHRRRREAADCKRVLTKLKDEAEQRRCRKGWSAPTSCPICLEDFEPQAEAAAAEEGAGPGFGSELDADSPSAALLGGDGDAGPSSEPAEATGAKTAPRRSTRLSLRRRSSSPCESQTAMHTPPPEGSGSGGAGRRADAPRVPVTLGCGHSFCEPCIEAWLEKSGTCPICRDRVAHDGTSSSSSAGDLDSRRRQQRDALADDLLATEIAFRFGSLQRRFPTIVTSSMVDSWSGQAVHGGGFVFDAALRDVQLHNAAVRQRHEYAGAAGHTSFGGGSGSGGGGAGGGW